MYGNLERVCRHRQRLQPVRVLVVLVFCGFSIKGLITPSNSTLNAVCPPLVAISFASALFNLSTLFQYIQGSICNRDAAITNYKLLQGQQRHGFYAIRTLTLGDLFYDTAQHIVLVPPSPTHSSFRHLYLNFDHIQVEASSKLPNCPRSALLGTPYRPTGISSIRWER
jgi:hypothetical protein